MGHGGAYCKVFRQLEVKRDWQEHRLFAAQLLCCSNSRTGNLGSFPLVVKANTNPLFLGHVHRHLVAQPAFPQQDIAHLRLHIDERL